MTAAIFMVVMTILSRRPGAGRTDYAVVIDRKPAEVFPWLTEPYRLTRWIDGLESSTPINGDGAVRGSRSRDVVLVNGKRYAFDSEITDIKLDTLLIMQMTSQPKGFTVYAMYELSETALGTKVHYVGQADYGGVFARVMEPFVTPQAQRKVKADMQRLKELLEAQPDRPGI